MNNLIKWATGGTLFGLLAVLSMYGEGAFKALAAFPALLAAFTSGLPFGWKSFALAALIAALVFAFAERRMVNHTGFLAEALALCMALLVTFLQQRFGGEPSGAPQALSALWTGMIAGLGAPFVVRAMMAAEKKPEPPQ